MSRVVVSCLLALMVSACRSNPPAKRVEAASTLAAPSETQAAMDTDIETTISAAPSFVMNVPQEGRYALRVRSVDATTAAVVSVTALVIDAAGHTVASISNQGDVAEELRLASGPYKVRFIARDGVATRVTFSWSRVVAASPAATIVDEGEAHVTKPAGSNGSAGSVDVAYTASTSQRINLRAGPNGPWVSMLREDESPVGHGTTISEGVFRLNAFELAAGRYLIRIPGTQNAAETFDVSVQRYEPAPPAGRITDRGSLRVTVSEDPGPTLELVTTRQTTYVIRGEATDDGDPKLTLRDSSARVMAANDDADGRNPRITRTLEPGTYSIEVGRFGGTKPTTVTVHIASEP